MDPILIIKAFIVGAVGTLVMDLGNILLSMTGIVAKVKPQSIGMVANGWANGRFVYANMGEVQPTSNPLLKGLAAHYTIGGVLSVAYAVGCMLWMGRIEITLWPILFGVWTSVFSLLLLYPSVGIGFFGVKGPKQGKFLQTSLINHLNYGLGMTLGFQVLMGI